MNRLPLAIAVFAIVATGAGADAATRRPPPRKPVCNQITDPKGDAVYLNPNLPKRDVVDIVDAAVSSDGKGIQTRIHLAGHDDTMDQASNFAVTFRFRPPKADQSVYVSWRHDVVQPLYEWGRYDPGTKLYNPVTTAGVKGSYDKTTNTVLISVSLPALTGLQVSANSVFTDLFAETHAWPVPYEAARTQQSSSDIATPTVLANQKYVAGWPSCLPVTV